MNTPFKLKTAWQALIGAAFVGVLTTQPCLAVERVFPVPAATGVAATDTTNIQAALNAAAATFNTSDGAGYSGVAVVFPAGTYVINQRLTMTTTAFPPQGGGIMIRGLSTLQTVIQSSGTAGAFYFALGGTGIPNEFTRLQIEDMKFFAAVSAAGPAIEIAPNGTNLIRKIRPMLRNLHINRTTTANYYTYGVKIRSANRAMFDNVRIYSSQNSCLAGIRMDDSYACNMIDCTIDGANYGFEHVVGGEGGLINRCTFNNVNIGVHLDYDPWNFYMSLEDGKILNSSITAKQCGAKINTRTDFFVSNTDFYSQAGTAAYTDVEMTGCNNVFITGNRFQGGGVNRTGVALLSLPVYSGFYGKRTLISDNIFGVGGTLGIGVSVGTNMLQTAIFNNDFTNTTTPYVNQGISTRFLAGAPAPFVSPAAAGDAETFSWGSIAGTVYDVKTSYNGIPGAAGDGVTDDTRAITNAAAQAAAFLNATTRKAVLYFPAGTYKLNSRIDLTPSSGAGLTIHGDGMGVSVIERYAGDTTKKGIFSAIVPAALRVDVHNLMLVARAADAGTAVYVKQPSVPMSRSLYVHDTAIMNVGKLNYFNPSIKLENLSDPFFQQVLVQMALGDFPTATAVKVTGGKGFACEHSALEGNLGIGLDVTSAGGDILIKNSMEAMVGPAISAKVDAGFGLFAIDGAHMNCAVGQLDIRNATNVSLVNTLTINKDISDNLGTAGIRLTSCTGVQIRNNVFSKSYPYTGNFNRRTIWLDGTANNDVTIYGNFFEEPAKTYIYNPSSVNNYGLKVRQNQFFRTDVDDVAGATAELTRMYPLNGLCGEDYLLRNKASGQYLTAKGTLASDLTCIETNIGDDVLWNIVYEQPVADRYLLTNKKVGKMLQANGTTEMDCNGTTATADTRMEFINRNDGYYTVKKSGFLRSVAPDQVDQSGTVVADDTMWEAILAEDLIAGMDRASLLWPDDTWIPILFKKPFKHPPAVFASLGGSSAAGPLTTRVRNVTTTGCEIRTQPWESVPTPNRLGEELTFIAMHKGSYQYWTPGGGTRNVEAGTIAAAGTGWQTRTFEVPFAATPVVFAQCTSYNGVATIGTRIRNVTSTAFEVRIQEDKTQDGLHVAESVDFIAIDPGTCSNFEVGRTDNVTQTWKTVPFAYADGWPNAGIVGSVQTFSDSDPCTLRYDADSITTTNAAVKVDDPDGTHNAESVGWMAFENK